MHGLSNDLYVLQPIGVLYSANGDVAGVRTYLIHLTYDPKHKVCVRVPSEKSARPLTAAELQGKPTLLCIDVQEIVVQGIVSVKVSDLSIPEACKYGLLSYNSARLLLLHGKRIAPVHITADNRYVNDAGAVLDDCYCIIRSLYAGTERGYSLGDARLPLTYIINTAGKYIAIQPAKLQNKKTLVLAPSCAADVTNVAFREKLNADDELRTTLYDHILYPAQSRAGTGKNTRFALDGFYLKQNHYSLPLNASSLYGDASVRERSEHISNAVSLLEQETLSVARETVCDVKKQLHANVNIKPVGGLVKVPAGIDSVAVTCNALSLEETAHNSVVSLPPEAWYYEMGFKTKARELQTFLRLGLAAPLAAYRISIENDKTSRWLLPLAQRDVLTNGTQMVLQSVKPLDEGDVLDFTQNIKDLNTAFIDMYWNIPATKIILPLAISHSKTCFSIDSEVKTAHTITFAPCTYEKQKAPKAYSAEVYFYFVQSFEHGFLALVDCTQINGTAKVRVAIARRDMQYNTGRNKLVVTLDKPRTLELYTMPSMPVDINGTGNRVSTLRFHVDYVDALGYINSEYSSTRTAYNAEVAKLHSKPCIDNINVPVGTLNLRYCEVSRLSRLSLKEVPQYIRHIQCHKGIKALTFYAALHYSINDFKDTLLTLAIHQGIFVAPVVVHIPKGTKASVIKQSKLLLQKEASKKVLQSYAPPQDNREVNVFYNPRDKYEYYYSWVTSPNALKALDIYLDSVLVDDLPEL